MKKVFIFLLILSLLFAGGCKSGSKSVPGDEPGDNTAVGNIAGENEFSPEESEYMPGDEADNENENKAGAHEANEADETNVTNKANEANEADGSEDGDNASANMPQNTEDMPGAGTDSPGDDESAPEGEIFWANILVNLPLFPSW